MTFDFDTWSNYLHVDLRLYHWGSGGEFLHENHVYLDMKDGHEINCRKFPFSALFTPDGYFELKIGKEKETRVFSPSVTKTSEWDNEWNGPYLYGNTTYVE